MQAGIHMHCVRGAGTGTARACQGRWQVGPTPSLHHLLASALTLLQRVDTATPSLHPAPPGPPAQSCSPAPGAWSRRAARRQTRGRATCRWVCGRRRAPGWPTSAAGGTGEGGRREVDRQTSRQRWVRRAMTRLRTPKHCAGGVTRAQGDHPLRSFPAAHHVTMHGPGPLPLASNPCPPLCPAPVTHRQHAGGEVGGGCVAVAHARRDQRPERQRRHRGFGGELEDIVVVAVERLAVSVHKLQRAATSSGRR